MRIDNVTSSWPNAVATLACWESVSGYHAMSRGLPSPMSGRVVEAVERSAFMAIVAGRVLIIRGGGDFL